VIEAMLADEQIAAVLGIPVGRPILGTQQVIRDETLRAYNFAVLRHRGDQVALPSQAFRPVAGSLR
jgi:DNA-binding GntR family transcriptional regulator